MNRIFFAMVAVAFCVAGYHQILWDPTVHPNPSQAPMELLSASALDAARLAVTIVLELIGYMALFLGLMKVAEASGLLDIIAKLLRPLMVRLFPDVPANHPAMGAMIMNMSANALGLGNAATPFGIKAMQELDKLNTEKGTATNAMALFLAINTSGVTLVPTTVIAFRASFGSQNAAGIIGTTLMATLLSTSVAVVACKLYQRFSPLEVDPAPVEEVPPESSGYPFWVSLVALASLFALAPAAITYGDVVSPWIIPGLITGMLGYGFARGVPVYEVFVEGAKEGFKVTIQIIPYLVAILVAIGMLRSSGSVDLFVHAVGPFSEMLGMPAEALPMAALRPFSGSGATGLMTATLETQGPDSFIGYLVSTLHGSTETTFYVIAVYFGAVQVKRVRHTMAAALTADFAGVIGAVAAVHLYWWFHGMA
ncbi:MAG: spore maturation protein [Rhodobacterales bacterium]|nr:spore maturation protein [Rhodobacterales bacterium]